MEKRSLLFTFTAATTAFVVILVAVYIYFRISAGCEDPDDTCLTPECVQVAAQILSYLDTSVNPCDNFYVFACGNFLSSVEIPDNRDIVSTSTNTYDELQKQLRDCFEEPIQPDDPQYARKLKNYYQACNNIVAIEERGLDLVKDLLKQVGGWPVLEGTNWNEKEFNWYHYIHKLNKLGIDSNFLITVSVSNDLQDPDRRIVKLDLPHLDLSPSILAQNSSSQHVRIYYYYMVNVARIMGANESSAIGELSLSLEFEKNLAHISIADEDSLSLSSTDLKKKYPSAPWFEYINNFTSPHAAITETEKFLVRAAGYIKNLQVLLKKTPRRVQANYIMWRAVKSLIPYLGENLRARGFAYESAVRDTWEKVPRWQECIRETYNRLPPLVSLLYLEKYFDQDSKNSVAAIYDTVKKEFFEVFKAADWLDNINDYEMARSEAIDLIAYPNDFIDVDELENLYEKLEVDPEEFLKSYLSIRRLDHDLAVRSLREPAILKGWSDSRIVAEMYTAYDPTEDRISISAGTLQNFLFNKNHPDYLNFGGIGFTIAREITRAFDEFGRQMNGNANFLGWWKTESEDSYMTKLRCFIKYYDDFSIPAIDERINGNFAAGEGIVNYAALKIAYVGYQKWSQSNRSQRQLAALKFTPNQLFWISYAINQCSKEKPEFLMSLVKNSVELPAEFKVIGALSNLEYFARDFNCNVSSPMNPSTSCAAP